MVEITNISPHGFWMFIDNQEYFIDFEHFPWFADATIKQLCDVELLHQKHLYWGALDIDLTVDMITHPEHYPLTAKSA